EAIDTNLLADTIQITIDCPGTLPEVMADFDQLRIVFANLIRNAGDAMPQGGRLTIRGHSVDDGIEVDFIDTGGGIAPDQLSRIMEPLYSTKAKGLGLGLAIARAILDKHQGKLRVASTPGQSTTFTVRLTTLAPEDKPS